jgi:5-methyltetrahydrofolate--homocysteine methyltransferase
LKDNKFSLIVIEISKGRRMQTLERISESIVSGESEAAASLVRQALNEGIASFEILNRGLVSGMTVVSEKFKNNEMFIPEVLVSARAMKAGMEILRPLLAEAEIEPRGKVVIGTIQGDLHDIGKNIVAMLLEGAGFEVVDLGADVPVEKFINSAREEKADIVGMSALLTTTMINMKAVIKGLQGPAKVMIGGAPVTQDFADQIGANGYAPNASEAIDLAVRLMKKQSE